MSDRIFYWTADWLVKNKFCLFQSRMTSSSQDQAKGQAFKGLPSPSVFLVLRQSEGRGGRGQINGRQTSKEQTNRGQINGGQSRKWEDSDLMVSILWEKNLRKVTQKSPEGFALDGLKALKTVWPNLSDLKFKAPNDLLFSDKKLGGVLVEFLNQGEHKALIVGLGLNVFSYPKGLPNATCLISCLISCLASSSFRSPVSSSVTSPIITPFSADFADQAKAIQQKNWELFLQTLLLHWSRRATFTK